jgi:two-component system, chemotaxis family, response regulator Rcp1
MVERYGGAISVESQTGQGSTGSFVVVKIEKCRESGRRAGHMPLQVLLVDDSPGDRRLTQEAFRDVNPLIQLHMARDGVDAMAFLRQEGTYADAVRPDLILLDLNLPKMDGRQVLAQIKGDHDLETIPTVILTTSEWEVDIVKAYELRANRYLTKPAQLDAFENLVKSINDFWLTKAKLPPQD